MGIPSNPGGRIEPARRTRFPWRYIRQENARFKCRSVFRQFKERMDENRVGKIYPPSSRILDVDSSRWIADSTMRNRRMKKRKIEEDGKQFWFLLNPRYSIEYTEPESHQKLPRIQGIYTE